MSKENYFETSATAGGSVLRVHYTTEGCFFKKTRISQGVNLHLNQDQAVFCHASLKSKDLQIPDRYTEVAVDPKNIITAFSNSIYTYKKSGITIRTSEMPTSMRSISPDKLLWFCEYKKNNSLFRWRSDGSKKIVLELQTILEKDLDVHTKARALCDALSRNLSCIGTGLRNTLMINELLTPASSAELSKYLKDFLATQHLPTLQN